MNLSREIGPEPGKFTKKRLTEPSSLWYSFSDKGVSDLFGRKRTAPEAVFDPKTMEAVLLSSICTGEKTAGFRDRETGKFTGVCAIRDEKDLKRFMKTYGVEDLRTIY